MHFFKRGTDHVFFLLNCKIVKQQRINHRRATRKQAKDHPVLLCLRYFRDGLYSAFDHQTVQTDQGAVGRKVFDSAFIALVVQKTYNHVKISQVPYTRPGQAKGIFDSLKREWR